MPRRRERGYGGLVFHVMNRAVRRATLFSTPADYQAFLAVLVEGLARVPMRVLDFALMKTHWHLVLWPRDDGDLTDFVWWVTLTHACRWQRVHGTRGTGPVYQGRFKAVPVETGTSLFVVCAYVERNPVEARLVERAEDWPWSAASREPLPGPRPVLHEWPVPRPAEPEWSEILRQPMRDTRHRQLRQCLERSAPFGSDEWRNAIVDRLNWTSGLRPGGRPRGPRIKNHSRTALPPSPCSHATYGR